MISIAVYEGSSNPTPLADGRWAYSLPRNTSSKEHHRGLEDAARPRLAAVSDFAALPLANVRDGLMFARGVLIRACSGGTQRGTELG